MTMPDSASDFASGPASGSASESAPHLDAEDAKLVTLARSTRARTAAAEGAAVRDLDGRTYAAACVTLPSFTASALQVCVAMAISSGARGLEAAVVLREDTAITPDLAVVREFAGGEVPVHLGDLRGTLVRTLR